MAENVANLEFSTKSCILGVKVLISISHVSSFPFVIFQKTIMPCANLTSGLTESRKTNSVTMTAFYFTKDKIFSRFYIKFNNGNTFKQMVKMGIK